MASDIIPTFNELFFRGNASALAQLFDDLLAHRDAVEALQSSPRLLWYRSMESEQQAAAMGIDSGFYRCYGFSGTGELPQALLWVFVEGNTARVVNIIAPQLFELKYLSYNRILASFADIVAKPAAAAGIEISYTVEKTLEEVLTPEPARLFKKFAKIANPDTGTLNPADAQRWQDFLISAHKHHVKPDTALLGRWLKVECNWQEQTIDHTLDELQTGLDLLERYEQTLNPPYADAA